MHEADDNPEQDNRLEAPPELVIRLTRLAHRAPFIPPTVDEAILRSARRLFDLPARRPVWRQICRWGIAAAVLLLMALLAHLVTRPTTTFVREDLNRDGRIDILDAFALARNLHANDPAGPPGPDLNNDGVVDESDVKAIATHAVALQKGSNS